MRELSRSRGGGFSSPLMGLSFASMIASSTESSAPARLSFRRMSTVGLKLVPLPLTSRAIRLELTPSPRRSRTSSSIRGG